jgi:oleate hydratase
MITTSDSHQVISGLDIIQHGFQRRETFGPSAVFLIEPGSTVTGSAIGTDSRPPVWHSLHADEELDEKWALWLELACKSTKFGNPYNFCTRQNESILESFTVTTKDLAFFEHLRCLSRDISNAGAFLILRESRWSLSVCVPDQPVFSNQPRDVRVIWGFSLVPQRKGDCVQKSMLQCSGAEIMAELLYHLNLPNTLIQNTITIPRVMPRMRSLLLAHSVHDRPLVIPQSTSNIGLVGPFVDIPRYSCVDMSYGVCTAQIAVSQLIDLNLQQSTHRAPFVSSMLRILFWK